MARCSPPWTRGRTTERGARRLARFVARAADAAAPATAVPAAGAVRQLRVVVQAPDFDATLAFYRDVVGMPQAEAYEADGGARVAILDAGRATLELANLAQVAFIDGVETDGGSSDRIRIALEVDDTAAVARSPRRCGCRGRGIRSRHAVAVGQRPPAGPGRPAADALPGAGTRLTRRADPLA